jgi:NAD(P)-dependent dehydrogenase (short-subunit alcohol dehydrogenase family)
MNSRIRFSERDLEIFSAASGDVNPLHLSAGYSRRTVYGQRVVFGALGAVACLGRVAIPPGLRVVQMTAGFHRPMFLDVDYDLQLANEESRLVIRLLDGSVHVLSLTLVFERGDPPEAGSGDPPPIKGTFASTEATLHDEMDLQPGLSTRGRYCPVVTACEELCARWEVTASRFIVEALLWASYVIGMEIPGRRALFFKLALTFTDEPRDITPVDYEGIVRTVDRRMEQVRMDVKLLVGGRQVVSGECWSFIRPVLSVVTTPDDFPVSTALAGKVALVVGASRGLGSAMARALHAQGATVVGTSRSGESDSPGDISIHQGDAADASSLQELRDYIAATHGRLDLLICNAFPPILPLRLEPNALPRLAQYVAHAVTMVLTPLCFLLDMLNQSGGVVVMISSSVVESPVREWPHYVAAKKAIEALAEIAPLQYPNISALIVRPQKLLTEMTNTPIGRRNAMKPEVLAIGIVSRLSNPPGKGQVEILALPSN